MGLVLAPTKSFLKLKTWASLRNRRPNFDGIWARSISNNDFCAKRRGTRYWVSSQGVVKECRKDAK